MYYHEQSHEGDSTSTEQERTPKVAPSGTISAQQTKLAPMDQSKVFRAIGEIIQSKGVEFVSKIQKNDMSSQTIAKHIPEEVQIQIVKAYKSNNKKELEELISPYLPKSFPGAKEHFDVGVLMGPVKDRVGKYLEPEDIKSATKAGLGFTQDHYNKALIPEFIVPERMTPEDVEKLKRAKTIIIDHDRYSKEYIDDTFREPIHLPNCQNVIIQFTEETFTGSSYFLIRFIPATNYTLIFQPKNELPTPYDFFAQFGQGFGSVFNVPLPHKIIFPAEHVGAIINTLAEYVKTKRDIARDNPRWAEDALKKAQRYENMIEAFKEGLKK
jgi:hypothetical protein